MVIAIHGNQLVKITGNIISRAGGMIETASIFSEYELKMSVFLFLRYFSIVLSALSTFRYSVFLTKRYQ